MGAYEAARREWEAERQAGHDARNRAREEMERQRLAEARRAQESASAQRSSRQRMKDRHDSDAHHLHLPPEPCLGHLRLRGDGAIDLLRPFPPDASPIAPRLSSRQGMPLGQVRQGVEDLVVMSRHERGAGGGGLAGPKRVVGAE